MDISVHGIRSALIIKKYIAGIVVTLLKCVLNIIIDSYRIFPINDDGYSYFGLLFP